MTPRQLAHGSTSSRSTYSGQLYLLTLLTPARVR